MDKANGGRVGGPTAGRDRVSCERCQSGSARGAAGDQPRVKSNGCRESKARKSGSHLTPRWRKADSNFRSRSRETVCRGYRRRCRTDRLGWRSFSAGALARRLSSGVGALPTAVPFTAGPKVRIQLPPAAGQLRTCSSWRNCPRDRPSHDKKVGQCYPVSLSSYHVSGERHVEDTQPELSTD